MELFSELYGAYYEAVAAVLTKAPLTEQEMAAVIAQHAFSESALCLLPKLKKEWGLLQKRDGAYASCLRHAPTPTLTLLARRWLKALLADPRIRLFLTDAAMAQMETALADVEPLFLREQFRCFDQFLDGDDFSDPLYIRSFRLLREAIPRREIVKITFTSGHGARVSGEYLPFRLEYSAKNDKFRVYTARIKQAHTTGVGLVNLSRITEIAATGRRYPEAADMARVFAYRRCKAPAELEIYPERNAVERFMMEFAGYEKRTERNEETGGCVAQLWYDAQDETELLIRLLSFGPVLEIKGPPRLRQMAKERIDRQYALLYPTDDNTQGGRKEHEEISASR